MLNTSLNVREPSEILSAGCRNLDGGKGGIRTLLAQEISINDGKT